MSLFSLTYQAMVYTLSLALRDSLANLLKARKARIEAEEKERARIDDEVHSQVSALVRRC